MYKSEYNTIQYFNLFKGKVKSALWITQLCNKLGIADGGVDA